MTELQPKYRIPYAQRVGERIALHRLRLCKSYEASCANATPSSAPLTQCLNVASSPLP